MKVCLLNSDAEQKKDGAQHGEHETNACFRSPAVACSLHSYSLLYSSKFKGMSQTACRIGWGVSVRGDELSITESQPTRSRAFSGNRTLRMMLIA